MYEILRQKYDAFSLKFFNVYGMRISFDLITLKYKKVSLEIKNL